MKASCGGWSAWWRLCDTPTGRSDDSIVCYWKINNLIIEKKMPKVPLKKVAPNIFDKLNGKSGLSYLIMEWKVPSTNVPSTIVDKWHHIFISDFFSPRE